MEQVKNAFSSVDDWNGNKPAESNLFKEIVQHTSLVAQKDGKYCGQCCFPGHNPKRKNSFFYYSATDSIACFGCAANAQTSAGREYYSCTNLADFRAKMKEPFFKVEVKEEEKLPRANQVVRLDQRLLSSLMLSSLTPAQAKAICLLMSQSLGRKVSEAEVLKTVEAILLETK